MNSVARAAIAGAGALLVISALSAGIYYLGNTNGVSKTKLEWAEENKRRDAASSLLVQKNQQLSDENRELTHKIDRELETHEKESKAAIAAAHAEFARRLRQSEGRAGIYREQAEGSALERERLASHAAELDRSLEEGRALVRELGETLRLRDKQIRGLSDQILADRALLN